MEAVLVDPYRMKIQVYFKSGPNPKAWTEAFDDLLITLKGRNLVLKPPPRYRPGDAVTVAMSPPLVAIRPATDADFDMKARLMSSDEMIGLDADLTDPDEWHVWLVHKVDADGRYVYRLHRNGRG